LELKRVFRLKEVDNKSQEMISTLLRSNKQKRKINSETEKGNPKKTKKKTKTTKNKTNEEFKRELPMSSSSWQKIWYIGTQHTH
jgi:hypothetical protein